MAPPSHILPGNIQLLSTTHLTSLWSSYGHIYRLNVRLDDAAASLILKTVIPPTDSTDVSHLRKLISYRVERYFYKHLSSTLTPASTVAKCYPVDDVCSLLLEDLEVRFPVSPGSGLSLQRSRAVLKWLANFHATFWGVPSELPLVPPPSISPPNRSEPEGVWQQGSYWYLDTRQEEYACIGGEWKHHLSHFQAAAEKLRTETQGRTLLHGDCKAANILFTGDSSSCALYDFQYVGGGLGSQDLVYFIGTSVDGSILRKPGGDMELLRYYFQELKQALAARETVDHVDFDFQVLQAQFDVAMVDWMRFMAGWGRWGNAGWVETNVRTILKRWTREAEESAALETNPCLRPYSLTPASSSDVSEEATDFLVLL